MSAADGDEWYLSFDCATKSFAYALVRVRPPPLERIAQEGMAHVRARDMAGLAASLKAAVHETFVLAGGGAADLAPGKADADVSTVERVRVVKEYLERNVAADLLGAREMGCPPADSPQLNVCVEYQMGPNSPARYVAAVILAQYWKANVFMVGPSLKNQVRSILRPDLDHCFFVEKYANAYAANKAHTTSLYWKYLARVYGHDRGQVLKKIPASLRKDFADSVVQVLGFIAYGDRERASEFF